MQEFNQLIQQAEQTHKENFPNIVKFERAIFFSWGCTIGDCSFCYMSTQPKDKAVKETRRSTPSILAEFILAKHLGWDIGFFTGGIGILAPAELETLLKTAVEITGEKIWLSVGAIPKLLLEKYLPYIKGVVGSTETINPELHKKVCPSKPLQPYERMFEAAKELNLEKAMTFIVGLGEVKEDLVLLKEFITKYNITKIHVYSLIPHEGTTYENASIPTKEDQAWWISQLRIAFPKLDIQCGIWEDRLENIPLLLQAGANSISKFKATKLFGTEVAKEVETQSESSGRKFVGTLTKMPNINWDEEVEKLSLDAELKEAVKKELGRYVGRMTKNCDSDKVKVISS